MKMGFWKVFLHELIKGLQKALTNFASKTAIHGLGFLVKKSFSVQERLFWAAIFIALTLYASLELRVAIVCKYFFYKWSRISYKISVVLTHLILLFSKYFYFDRASLKCPYLAIYGWSKKLPYARHYNPHLIWNHSWL